MYRRAQAAAFVARRQAQGRADAAKARLKEKGAPLPKGAPGRPNRAVVAIPARAVRLGVEGLASGVSAAGHLADIGLRPHLFTENYRKR